MPERAAAAKRNGRRAAGPPAASPDALRSAIDLVTRVAAEGFWDWDVRTNAVYYSPTWKKQLGYAGDEIADSYEEWSSRIHPDDKRRVLLGVQLAYLDPRADYRAEYRLRHRDGSYRWILAQGGWICDAGGAPMRFLGTHIDVTERKTMEQALRLRSSALESAANAVVIADRQGTIEWVNRAFTELTGYAAAEVVGQNPRLFKSGRHGEAFYREFWETILTKHVWRGEMVNRRKDGTLYDEEMSVTAVRDDAGAITHFIAIKQDITARRKLEEQFLRSQRMESLGVLAGGIAHDLNNVLAPILMSLDYLRRKVSDDQSARMVELIGTSAMRGADIVKQVLTFSRGMNGERSLLQPKHLVREIEGFVRETFPKGIEIHTEVDRDLWPIVANATQIHQILLNLCVNARDAMPQSGVLTIGAHNALLDDHYAAMDVSMKPGNYVVLAVADTGTGVPADIREKIFDPFFTTKAAGKGTGLGLSTVMGLVKSHNGFVRLYTETGRGTQFKVYLPAAEVRPSGEQKGEWQLGLEGSGETVLVVDDEAHIREITKTTLEASGYEVLTAADGIEAVTLYSRHQDAIRVVLTDMAMPSLDGVATMQILRKINPNVRCIASSGFIDEKDALEGCAPVVKAFLQKPYSAKKLLAAVREVMAGA